MDKGKNRNDLLAAGRKKLQQFRQKKETKSSSSHGKSLKKSSKEEFDLDADTASVSGKFSSEFQPDGGELPVSADSDVGIKSQSHLSENSIAPEIEVEDTGMLALPPTHGSRRIENTEVQPTELPHRELSSREYVDSSVVNTGVDVSVGAASDIIVSEADSKSLDNSVSVDKPAKSASVVAIESAGFEDQVEGRDVAVEASSSYQESILPLLPIQGRDNQEASSFESKQSDEGGEVNLRRGGNLPFCELGGGTEVPSAAGTLDTSTLERSCDAGRSGNSGEMSALLADSAITSGFVGAMTNRIEEGSTLTRMGCTQQQHILPESFEDDGEGKAERLPENEICNGGSFDPPISNMCPVSVLQLRELIKTLSDEEFSAILELMESVSKNRPLIGSLSNDSCYHILEKLKEELILSDLAKNICQLLTSDQSMEEMELDCLRHDNISLKEACQRNQTTIEELGKCRLELKDALGGRDAFENELNAANAEVKEISARAYELEISLGRSQDDFSKLLIELDNLKCETESLNGTVALLTEDIHKLKHEKELLLSENEKLSAENNGLESSLTVIELENSKLVANLLSFTEEKKKLEEGATDLSQENKRLSKEVVDCNSFAASLQLQIADLHRNLTLLTVERTKIGEDKEYLSSEKESISSELVILQEALSSENAKYTSLEITLNEVKVRLEQLTEDNIFMNQKLNVYETTLREIDYIKSLTLPQAAEDGNQAVNRWRGVGGGTQNEMLEQGTHDNYLELSTLKQNSEMANNIVQKLEKAIEGLRLQTLPLTKASNKSSGPGISKIIQAFELKASIDEHELMERAVNESRLPVDPFTLMKELTVNLRKVLLQLEMDAESASMVFMNERRGHEFAKATYANLKEQYNALEGHSQGLMTNNIELGVLYDATKVHMADAGTRIMELELAIDILNEEKCSLNVAVGELTTKLCTYETKISELTDQISYLQQSSNEMASLVSTQLDNLKNEAAERASALENNWNALATQTLETTRKLDESVEKCISLTDITRNNERLDNSVVSDRVTASVNVAVTVIEDLKQKLDNAHTEHKAISSLCKEVNEKCESLQGMNELALALLNEIYSDLHIILSGSVSRSDLNVQIVKLPNPLDYVYFDAIMKQLEESLSVKLELESVNSKLNTELMNRSKELEDISKKCLDSVSIKKLMKDIHVTLKLEDTDVNLDEAPASQFISLILLLLQKYDETVVQIELSSLEYGSKMMELTEMEERIHELNTITVQQENEILLLRETSSQMEEALITAQAELKEKIGELEQSEQRVTSIREKLSIAVAKGKGLVVQRDGLKHSLVETSSELEKCMEELKLKETRLHEVDLKLKIYSEAGERVEALESELSYIRNSATALRESFLLKDSVLQRIEEILEDLELPEHFHSKDIIEKVDWLARSILVNFEPQTDYDQKNYLAKGAFSDDSFVVMDDRKDGVPTSTISNDHLRLKYEELQSKFYGLAEQNEMLEQSLMLRNNLVQRWEELLDMINIPSHLQSLEAEDRIKWLGKELSVAQSDRSSLQQKVDYFENLCGSLTTDLDELRKNFSGLEADFQTINSDRELLFQRYETLFSDSERLLVKAVENDVENVILHCEVHQLEEYLCNIHREILTLQDLVSDVLQGFEIKGLVSASSIDCLGEMVRKLIEEYTVKSVLENSSPKENTEETSVVLDTTRSIDALDSSKLDADAQKKELNDALLELMCVREERDKYIGMYQYTVSEVESLDKKMVELQELLNQEEQKSASVREKLNVAVRKGKSLVQQRDSLKQTIEGMTSELDCLKSEIKRHEDAVASYEQKIKNLSSDSKRVEALESENLLLRNRMIEKEDILREKEHILSMILEKLGDIDVGVNSSDPVMKLKEIEKLCYDLRASVVSLEQESKKSRRAAELLLTELNEVQERNDAFQDELAQASHELAELTMERDRAEASKLEALSRIEKLSSIQSDEKKSQFSEFVGLISRVDELRKTFHDINHSIVVILSKDLEFWQNVGTNVQLCHNVLNPVDVVGAPLSNASAGFKSWNPDDKGIFLSLDSGMGSNFLGHLLDENLVVEEVICSISHYLKEFNMEIDDLETMLNEHSVIIHEQATCISKLVLAVHGELISQKESVDALKGQVSQMELGSKEKDMEIEALHTNIGLLHEACKNLVMEIEQKKAELVGNSKDFWTLNSRALTFTGQLLMDERPDFSSEEYIQSMAGRVLSAVREFTGLKADIIGGSQKEMKITIENLQNELKEKDIQKERICTELVSQIKKAEATSASYSLDLQSSKTRVHDLEKLVEDMNGKQVPLEHKIKELEAGLTSTLELEERVKSLLGVVSSKDQEIEALMQALDEEEIQMEDLTNKNKELEKDLKLKNRELEDLEASRGKVIKKLAVTVSKFDELHHLSGSLLTEVESLQSQLIDRDTEISFLRQEVTRCANDVLVTSQTNSTKTSEEICKYLTWFDMMISRDGVYDVHHVDKDSWIMECKEQLKKKTASILTEIEELEMLAQSKDELLQMERNKCTELTKEKEMLEKSLREKDQRLNMLEAVGETEKEAGGASEISEAEPLIKKWVGPGTAMTPLVRGMRKSITDQVAIAIDMDHGAGSRLEDEDDDKGHGFKSLTKSKIVPKFTRPVTDMVDGLWVSCDRALMRQPTLRLGIIIYWAVLHALLATFVV